MSDKLPLIPGYQVHIEKRQNFAKSHLFDVKNGIPVTDIKRVAVERTDKDKLIAPPAPFVDPRANAEAGAKQLPMSEEPAWVKYDRKVLRYYAYFSEPVFNSPNEKLRVRVCRIYFYLEDKTIHIEEEKVSNSGLPQGRFLERARVPKSIREYLDIPDLLVGSKITVHSREFNIFDADASTRKFVKEQYSIDLGARSEPPVDDYTARLAKAEEREPVESDIRTFVEASLGKPMKWHLAKVKKFLANDRKVLKFSCVWDDPSLYGAKRKYTLYYFLADDTIEVSEIHTPNSGRGNFPQLLKRGQLPKIPPASGAALIGRDHSDKIEYYTHADLRIGSYVTVYSRHFLIIDADPYTQHFYKKVHGLTDADFVPIEQKEEKKELPKPEIPPYNGYGGEIDSLGSFYSLVPKPPRKNWEKLVKFDRMALLYLARMVSDNPEDADRRFTIEFFLADDTLRVFEQSMRNSGFVAGKFLDRNKVKNGDTATWFKPSDFFVGATIRINGFRFELLEADESTKTLQSGGDLYTSENIKDILIKLCKILYSKSYSKKDTFRNVDEDGSNTITINEFNEIVKQIGWTLCPADLQKLWAYFDEDKSNTLTYDEFYKVVEKYNFRRE